MTTTSPVPPAGAAGLLERIVRRPRPWVTATVFAVTAATGIAQLVDSALLDEFRRDPAKIDDGQWWRLGSAMFFQDGWTRGLIFNLLILAFFGIVAERAFGRTRWLLLYFGCGLFGQTMSYLWLRSTGAGNSMCVAGLIGALTVVALVWPDRLPAFRPPRLALLAVPVLAVVDTVVRDNHGLPLLLGMVAGFVLLPRDHAQLAGK
ncbi:rhomboid family intramembrane serine protease [Nocardia sp. NPDC051030]|uniref:rhomboid family intramembrane serine protease n=1 Tax=Nocardia sp. NPDC051030 TaxID=3155162 RepID=UPI0034248003